VVLEKNVSQDHTVDLNTALSLRMVDSCLHSFRQPSIKSWVSQASSYWDSQSELRRSFCDSSRGKSLRKRVAQTQSAWDFSCR
jgi:hypothetical protein